MVSPARPTLTLPASFEGVVLDLDGLLVRSEDLWWRAKETIFARHGVAFEVADHLAVLGTSDDVSARYFAQRFGADPSRVDDIRDEYLGIAGELFGHGVEVNPGAVELLAHLRGRVPVGLASNTRLDLVTTILDSTPFSDTFDAIVTADDGTPKPAPDLYLIACRRLGITPAASVAVEDSPTGVAAAKAAGLTCIGVPSHPDEPLPMADIVVASLLDLL